MFFHLMGIRPMRELVRYTCATCGGALIVNRSEEVFKCPFCGNGFDAAKMHKREILNDAETNMKQMEFNAAKDKFDSILKSEPQDFDALKGIVLCAGKLRSLESFQSMDRIRSCEWTGMVNELTDVKKRAKKEDVPFFTMIGELLVTIEEQTRLQSELTNAENKSKNEIAKQNQTEESGRGLLYFFMFLFILLTLGVFVSGTPVSGIYCGIGCAVLFIIIVVLVKVTGHFGSNSHKKKMYYIRKELIETRKKLDEIENKYDNYYRELLLMDHSGSDKQAPVYSSLQDYSEEQGYG